MRTIGIDVGSCVTKLLLLDGEDVLYRSLGREPDESEVVVKNIIQNTLETFRLKRNDIDVVVATGLFKKKLILLTFPGVLSFA